MLDLETADPEHLGDERVALAEALAEAIGLGLERARLSQAREELTHTLVHDLRSPIARIRGLAEVTLTNNQSVEEFQQMAASTVEECDRLMDMINTMLTISRTEAGMQPEKCLPVDLSVVIVGACELFQPLAEDKTVRLELQIEGANLVHGDQRLLQRMVANLLDNAIKYSPQTGRVVMRLGDRNQHPVLSISDKGPGIPVAERARVLQRFYRMDQSRSRQGSGLGLSLVDAVAQMHNAKIVFDDNHPGLIAELQFRDSVSQGVP